MTRSTYGKPTVPERPSTPPVPQGHTGTAPQPPPTLERDLNPDRGYAAIVAYLEEHTAEVVTEWERLLRRYSSLQPGAHRIGTHLELILALAAISLCTPADLDAHRRLMNAAAEHGYGRRSQGVPEHVIPEEYHLLMNALRSLVGSKFRHNGADAALVQLGTATTLAINASMWGYYRAEIQALGRWDRGMERLMSLSPFLRRGPSEEH